MTEPSRVLTRRELNRTLLARQGLRERVGRPAREMIEHLAGMNGQFATGPYIGLWNRLMGFERDELTQLLRGRHVVRATLMRGTIHLVTDTDYLLFAPALRPVLERGFRGYFAQEGRTLDIDALVSRSQKLLDQAPLSRPEMERALADLEPDAREGSRAFAVRAHLPLVQVPPAGEWESRGEVRYTLAEAWIGRPLGEPEAGQEHIVHRYLTAFGPASLADIGAWSGLSRLRAVLDRLAPQLRTFTDEAGGTLYDVADGTLGDADDAAPARLLPDYDNVLFAHKDRTRVLPEEYRGTVVPTGRRMPGTFLVDGFVAGTWRIECTGTLAALHLAPFGRLRRPARDELVQEAERLVRFAEPDAARHEVRLPS